MIVSQEIIENNSPLPRQKKINNAVIEIIDGAEMMLCNTCGQYKRVNIENFIQRNDNKIGWRRQCRSCVSARRSVNEYTQESLIKKSNQQLKSKFGITIDDVKKMYDSQHGKCKICGKPGIMHGIKKGYKDKSDTLHVDHCHATGKVRGLLCSNCNVAIGLMNESIENMLSAIDYIKEHDIC